MTYNPNLYPVNEPIAGLNPSGVVTPLQTDVSGNLLVSGGGGGGGGLSTNDGTFAKETGGNLDTLIAASTGKQATGSLVANNGVVTIAVPDGMSTWIAEITGTFVGTITFKGSTDSAATYNATSGHLMGTSTVSTTATAPGVYRGNCAGFTNFQVLMSPYTSGTAVITLRLSAGVYAVSITNGVTIANGNANGQTTMSASAPIAIASDQSKLPTKAASGDFATGAIVDLPVKGANTKANSMPVTMASDQTAIPTLDTNSAAIKTDLDTVVTQTLTPNVSDRWARQLGQVDLARVLGAALSISNPNIVETNTLNAVRNGQAYVAQARNTTASSIVVGLSVFNGSGSGKSLLITSIQFSLSASTNALGNSLYINTVDPALGTLVTPTNLKGGGGASVATCSSTNTVVTPAGTLVKGFGTVATTTVEVLNPNQTILLPAGSANGIAMYVTPATVVWSVAISWIEF